MANYWIIVPAVVAASVLATAGAIYTYDSPVTTITVEPLEPTGTNGDQVVGTNDIRPIPSNEDLAAILQEIRAFQAKEAMFASGAAMDVRPVMDRAVSETSAMPALSTTNTAQSGDVPEHSATNIQVKNVDEPDYLKNDAEYIYVASSNVLSIIDAYPAESAEVVFRGALDIGDRRIHNIFLNGDRLAVFYQGEARQTKIAPYDYVPLERYTPVTHALVMDVSDRNDPQIIQDYSIDGYFRDARMINDYAYVITDSSVDYGDPRIPMITDSDGRVTNSEAFFFDSIDHASVFTTITAIDLLGDSIGSKSFLTGYTGTYYVSEDAFYITYLTGLRMADDAVIMERFFEVVVPLLPVQVQQKIGEIGSNTGPVAWGEIEEVMQSAYKEMDREDLERLIERIDEALREHDPEAFAVSTAVHKVGIDGGVMNHEANTAVIGTLLNQFSIDQSGDRLRVVVTEDNFLPRGGFERSNAVYVLDEQLEEVGRLTGIAPNESVFASRFMGDRLYLVTFEQIDPFFVIDLSNDTPAILGELKIPGFSNYLHPAGDDLVVGVGRETSFDGRVSTEGVKVSLFSVADVSSPAVVDEIVIGDSSVYSVAEWDHKAFFFDGVRGIMSIPIQGGADRLGEANRDAFLYDWFGFYIISQDEMGLDIKGTVEHSGRDSHDMNRPRTLYIGEVLYTISDSTVVMSDYGTLEEINAVRFSMTGGFTDTMSVP